MADRSDDDSWVAEALASALLGDPSPESGSVDPVVDLNSVGASETTDDPFGTVPPLFEPVPEPPTPKAFNPDDWLVDDPATPLSQPAAEPAPQPEPTPVAQPTPQPEPTPVAQPTPQPLAEPAPQPAANPPRSSGLFDPDRTADMAPAGFATATLTAPAKTDESDVSTKESAEQNTEEADSTDEAGEKERSGHSLKKVAIEWLAVIFFAVILAFVVRSVLFTAFYVESESMEPTLVADDRVLVNRLSFSRGEPAPGEVVVFHRVDADASLHETNELVKRVIGIGGQTIQGRNNRIMIYNEATETFDRLVEPYLADNVIIDDFGPVDIPEGTVFVLGDNRSNSVDSRVFGPVPMENIVGRAFVVFWPVDRLAVL